ncbi:hypothetical protein ACX40Y_13300 [Sphingomonas sp. RS6]
MTVSLISLTAFACLQRHDISRLPALDGRTAKKKRFKVNPIGYYFHFDIADLRTEDPYRYTSAQLSPVLKKTCFTLVGGCISRPEL